MASFHQTSATAEPSTPSAPTCSVLLKGPLQPARRVELTRRAVPRTVPARYAPKRLSSPQHLRRAAKGLKDLYGFRRNYEPCYLWIAPRRFAPPDPNR